MILTSELIFLLLKMKKNNGQMLDAAKIWYHEHTQKTKEGNIEFLDERSTNIHICILTIIKSI